MSSKFEIVIFGSGSVAESHIKSLMSSNIIKPAAVYGSNTERIKYLSEKYSMAGSLSIDEVLSNKSIKIVDICNSNHMHFETALKSIQSGKSVIIEKPAAFKSSEVETLVSEADMRNLCILICFQKRYNLSFRSALKILNDFDTGEFISGKTVINTPRDSSYYKSKWKNSLEYAGGGVLIYQAIHDLDLLCLLLGRARDISGKISNSSHNLDVEDSVELKIEFCSGGTLEVNASSDSDIDSKIKNILNFKNGKLIFDDKCCTWEDNKDTILLDFRNDDQPDFVSSKYKSVLNNTIIKERLPGVLKTLRIDSFKWLLEQYRLLKYNNSGCYRNVLSEIEYYCMTGDQKSLCSLKNAVEPHRVIEEFYSKAR
ncbi:MAG: Gfo/Idh/MocA family protein [Planctomycetota bacterium]